MLPHLSPSQRPSALLLVMFAAFIGLAVFYDMAVDHYEKDLQHQNLDAMSIAQQDALILANLNGINNATSQLIEQNEISPMPAGILKSRIDDINQRLQQLQNQEDETIKLHQQLRPDSQLNHKLHHNFDRYHRQISHLLDLLHQDIESAEQEILQATPLLQGIQAGLVRNLQTEISNARQLATESFNTYRSQRQLIQYASLAIFLLMALITLHAFRQQGKQLRATEDILQQLGDGNDDVEIHTSGSGFERIYMALRQFRETLRDNRLIRQQLLRQNATLEAQVAERTAHLQENNLRLSEEIRQRQTAEQQQKLFETIFRHTDDAVMITTPEAEIVMVNKGYEKMMGRPLEKLIGKKPPISSSGHHDKAFYQEMWSTLLSEGRWRGEIINRTPDGELVHALLTINAVLKEDGSVMNYVGIMSDIRALKDAQDKLQKMAYFDPLTGLPNRVLLADRLAHEIQVAHKENQGFATVFLDLDRFKYVNDTLGHTSGDELLKETARRLLLCTRLDDTVARLSGDEFCLVLRHSSPAEVAVICENILQALHQPYLIAGREVEIGGSLGIAMYPENGHSGDELTKHADAAMYQAKAQGRNRYCFFEQAIAARLQDELTMYTRISEGIEQQEFILYYQPVESLENPLQSYAEALIRWPQAGGSMISPGIFIPFAESHGLIEPLSDFVLKTASRFMAHCQSLNLKQKVSINLSAKQLARSDLLQQLLQLIANSNITPSAIELELTESALISNLKTAANSLQSLRAAGFSIAIDDFGAGYSSLNYLVELPIDKVKIDQRFIWTLFNTPRNQAVVKAILDLARTIGVQTVAEGVETVEQYTFLREHGCHYIQGYYLARPMPEADYLAFRLQHLQTDNLRDNAYMPDFNI